MPQDDHIVKDGRSILLTDIFEVNPATGDIMLDIPDVLDAEMEREAGFLKILAKDNGVPSLNTTTMLQVCHKMFAAVLLKFYCGATFLQFYIIKGTLSRFLS